MNVPKTDFAQDAFSGVLTSEGSQFSFRRHSQAIKWPLNAPKAVLFQDQYVPKTPKAEIPPNQQPNR
jgi:hypothetical protein